MTKDYIGDYFLFLFLLLAPRLKIQSQGSNHSLKAQTPATRPKPQRWGQNLSVRSLSLVVQNVA